MTDYDFSDFELYDNCNRCPYCEGGKVHVEGSLYHACPDCNGSGKKDEEE